ncbi:putative oxidoreductase [Hordeum vulgare]|nr:putative oxidoreductase [Hordeum vulgare]
MQAPKARGLAFSRFEDILLIESWLNTTTVPISGTEQKGSMYWKKIWKDYHERKEYVEPHPIVSTKSDRRALEAAKAAMAAVAEQAARMQAEEAARMQTTIVARTHVEEAARM